MTLFIKQYWGRILVAVITLVCLFGGPSVFATADAGTDPADTFCLSCHEMKENVLPDYRKSTHFMNASGVRADCTSCHVPQEIIPMMVRKAMAAREVIQSLRGVLDTPGKFDENRYRLARRVWADMEANDSRECRSCHERQAFDFTRFKKAEEAKRMEKGLAEGQTCISCHKGIVHRLPDMSSGYKMVFKEIRDEAQKGIDGDVGFPVVIVPLFQEKGAKKPAGKVLAATRLNVLDEDDDWLKVRIDGWQQDGVEAMIYEEQGKRIFSAALSKKGRGDVQRKETLVDPDTEQTWHKVSLECWVQAKDMISDRDRLWGYGSEMLTSVCSTCHSSTPPGHFKANQWIGNLKAMKHNISLSKEEYRFFLKYLQMHASDMGGSH